MHYGKAIRSMKNDLSSSTGSGGDGESVRRVLIACLLVCCLEGMWGNSFNTLAHARSGLQVLRG